SANVPWLNINPPTAAAVIKLAKASLTAAVEAEAAGRSHRSFSVTSIALAPQYPPAPQHSSGNTPMMNRRCQMGATSRQLTAQATAVASRAVAKTGSSRRRWEKRRVLLQTLAAIQTPLGTSTSQVHGQIVQSSRNDRG